MTEFNPLLTKLGRKIIFPFLFFLTFLMRTRIDYNSPQLAAIPGTLPHTRLVWSCPTNQFITYILLRIHGYLSPTQAA